MLQKTSTEERNDENNKDESPNVHHFASHPASDDYNKESHKNTLSCEPDKFKKQNLPNNTSYCEDVMHYLFYLICYLKQFVYYQQYQANDGMIVYKYTVCLTIATISFDLRVTLELYNRWKELCSIVIQCWLTLFDSVQCLEELSDDGIQQWKKLQQTMMCQYYPRLCSTPSFPVLLQHCDLSRFFSLPVDLNLLDNPCNHVALQILMFGDMLTDDVLLLRNAASTRLTSDLFVSIFLRCHKQLPHVKSSGGMGRQASDRSDNNGRRSHNETSKQSGSAGSSTSSSTTGGGYNEGIKRTGSTGSSGRGDDDKDDDGWKRDRKSRYVHDIPGAIQWEEEESNDDNETSSAAAATTYNSPGRSKKTKKPRKTATPIMYELALNSGNDLCMMFAVTSPMMNGPLSEDNPYGELTHAAVAAASGSSVISVKCYCEGYHDKVLYCVEMLRSYKNLRMLCLPVYCCEPVTAQACDEVVPPSTSTTEAVSVLSLLPPPGGGSDVQFKDTLMVFCTIVAAAYSYLYNDHCYFDRDDLNVCNIFVATGKTTSVSIHAVLYQLEDRDKEDVVRTSTNEGLVCLANSIFSPYQHTDYSDSAEWILTIMKHHPPYENDLDVLHALLVYHDWCVPFTNTTVAYVQ